MSEQSTTIETSVDVAGMSIVHRLEGGIALSDSHGVQATARCSDTDDITVHHGVGPASVEGLRAVLHVNERVTYFEDGGGDTVIHLLPLEADAPRQLLRTLHRGREYRVEYAFAPARPISRRDSELSAYTLALAARERGIMAHGCGFVLPMGTIALCLGTSGAGKSTLGRLMRDGAGLTVLNDDRIVVTRASPGFHAWGTPWPGRAGIVSSGDGKLSVIGVIKRAPSPRSRLLPPREARRTVLETFALPLWDSSRMAFALEMIDAMLNAVPVVEIGYPLSNGTPEWIVETLTRAADEE